MSLFSFQGRIGRIAYLLASVAAFFSQHVLVVAVSALLHKPLEADLTFWIVPLRALVTQAGASDPILIAGFAFLLVIAWLLAALAFRRAADAGFNEAITAAAAAPLIQIPVILLLAVLPPRPREEAGAAPGAVKDYSSAAVGVVAGMGLTLLAVAVGTLIFRVYGYGLFVMSPFAIGATTGYFANRRTDIGSGATMGLVLGATTLGGIALILAALEGAVCLVLASPLGAGVAVIGGVFGRAVARGRTRGRQAAPAFALLPVLFALEHMFALSASFDTVQSVAIDAPVATVWRAILHMDPIEEPLSLPYRLGVAYPIGGEVVGEGVGAVRHGVFSTGTALERVAAWEPARKLVLAVETDIPAMRELSPYAHVHAPHAVGYFTTRTMTFELAPRDGTVEVVLRTEHEIRLDPILYWMPFARWMVAQNNARVLAHIRRQAERSVREAARE
jgi:uncharacterized membrane protein YhaH (DUF805 family)